MEVITKMHISGNEICDDLYVGMLMDTSLSVAKSGSVKKQYELILKKKESNVDKVSQSRCIAAGAFDNSDDDTNDVVSSIGNPTSSKAQTRAETRRQHELALAEDPTIFDYDSIYDDIQSEKHQKVSEQKEKDKECKSKYAGQIIQAHRRRLLEQLSRDERKQIKEREAEAGEFDGKEKFVTGAYRQQLEEMEKFRLQEASENRLDELTAVENQKGGLWKGGFYRTLLNDLARDGTGKVSSAKDQLDDKVEDDEDSKKTTKTRLEKQKRTRKNFGDSDGDSEEEQDSKSGIKSRDTSQKKLIYSHDSDAKDPSPVMEIELKPGLNILGKNSKKPTKAERIRERFTPPPCDDERNAERRHEKHSRGSYNDDRRIESGRHRHRSGSRERRSSKESRRDRDHRKNDHASSTRKSRDDEKDEKSENAKKSQQSKDPASKRQRLKVMRDILKQRNNENDIMEFRLRYLERKEKALITIPL